MKILLLITFSLLLSVNVFAQYPEITIMDIQYQDPDSLLLNGDQPSPYNGDTVTVVGVVMVAPFRDANPDSGTTLIAGAPAIILQDTSETDWAGIIARFPGSNATFNVLDTGTVIRATGWVDEYYVTTQLNIIEFEGSDVLGFMERPQPVTVTLDSLAEMGGREGKLLAERWEEVFVRVENVTATSGGIGSGSYEIFDGNNTQVIIGNASSYFRNANVPVPGTILSHVTGFIQNRDNVSGTTFANLINPTYPGDTEVSVFPPAISDITRNPGIVGYGDPVTVTATIVDPDGTVAEAKLIYRKNMGAHNEIMMTNPSGDLWNGIIPAQNDSSIIDYFVRAVDNENNVSIFPSDTSSNRYFYLVLDRPLAIQDVQYSPFGGGFSGFHGYQVTVRGIVTADTTDIGPINPQVYIQNGTGSWSGIKLMGTETLNLHSGDDISVTGTVGENYSVTEIYGVDDPGNIQTHGTLQPLPNPELLTTSTIDFIADGSIQAEQWEGVLIRYEDVEVTNENADGSPGPGGGGNSNFGEILVKDAVSTHETRVELQDGNHEYHNYWADTLGTYPIRIRTGDTFDELIGILWYSFGNYKLVPRTNDDFVGHTTDVNNDTEVPNDFTLSQNYPNPFNPSTKIQYALPVASNVTLKVFNILGQEVMTLINNQSQTSGLHEVTFDASRLPSGIYLYRLQSENFVDAKKMILLK